MRSEALCCRVTAPDRPLPSAQSAEWKLMSVSSAAAHCVAMSSFTQTEQQIQQLAEQALTLQQQYDALKAHVVQLQADLASLTPSTSADAHAKLTPLQATYGSVSSQHAQLQPVISKYSQKAAEKDPDKQLYGSKQVKRIEASQKQFDGVSDILLPLTETFVPVWQQLQQTVNAAESERRAAADKAEAAAAAEREAAAAKQRELDAEQDAMRAAEEQKYAKQREIDAKRDYERKLAADEERREKEEADRTERIRRERAVREQEERVERQREAEAQRIRQQQQRRERQARIEQEHQQREQQQAQRLTMDEQQQLLRDSLQQLVSQASSSQADGALTTLLRYINNVLENPMQADHRTVHANDTAFLQHIADRPSGVECVQAVGFVSKSSVDSIEQQYVLQASAEAWTLLTAARKMVEEQLLEVRNAAG